MPLLSRAPPTARRLAQTTLSAELHPAVAGPGRSPHRWALASRRARYLETATRSPVYASLLHKRPRRTGTKPARSRPLPGPVTTAIAVRAGRSPPAPHPPDPDEKPGSA